MAQNKKTPKKKAQPATAFHLQSKNGVNVVGIGNLRVIIVQDDDTFFAQGLEIDYAAEGSSLEEVQRRFQEGLVATVNSHVRVYNDITRILRVAPSDVWNQYLTAGGDASGCTKHRFSCIAVGQQDLTMANRMPALFPFQGIDYYIPSPAMTQ